MNIDKEWESFLLNDEFTDDEQYNFKKEYNTNSEELNVYENIDIKNKPIPKSSDIYISTKTQIIFLDKTIDLKKVFWEIPIMAYHNQCDGIIKKQMKLISMSKDELDFIQDKLKNELYYEEYIITHIDNENGRIKFKDIRKVSIGISKKDILNYRSKKKSAFYNCFVIIMRIKVDNIFKEFHVKVFNTGKVEIPGIQNKNEYELVLNRLLYYLQPFIDNKLNYIENSEETVLINSNFNCGYFIDRVKLHNILKTKYNIESIYEPCCLYPGIQNKFYYYPNITTQNGTQNNEQKTNFVKVSFMIFRTGSVLIVGKCDEEALIYIYEYLKRIFEDEYFNIVQHDGYKYEHQPEDKINEKKIRHKHIIIQKTM